MTLLAIVIATLAAFYAGLQYDRLKRSLVQIQKDLQEKIDRKPQKQEEKSVFLDPLDIVTKTRMEHEEMLRKLNPHE